MHHSFIRFTVLNDVCEFSQSPAEKGESFSVLSLNLSLICLTYEFESQLLFSLQLDIEMWNLQVTVLKCQPSFEDISHTDYYWKQTVSVCF